MAHEIITIISPNGDVEVQVKGVKGRSCKQLTKELEEKLGVATSDKPTKEMYEPEQRVAVRNRA